jgi:hypothetical protein
VNTVASNGGRPDIAAATRSGDWSQPMDGEGNLALSTIEQAIYWRQIYADILEMQEKVLNRIRVLMSLELIEIQHEVELTNVPVVVAQVERFRQRLSYWDSRIAELDGR